MSIKIIGLDLDGTTLGINGKLPPINKIAIERAIDAGINVVVTTGRVISAVPEDIMNISGLRYIISSNGAHVRDLKQGHDVYSSFIEPDVIGRVVDLARERNLYLEAFHDGRAYIDSALYHDIDVNGSIHRRREYVLRTRNPLDDIFGFMLDNCTEIENINIFFEDMDKLEDIRKIVSKYDDANVTSSVPNNIEIGGLGSSKSKALSELMKILSIDGSELLCCGDAANDIPMLQLAEIGVAMENAWDIVKENADYITDTNVNGGVGKAILKFCFGEEV